MSSQEKCTNPFKKRQCGNTDIQLYIVIKGTKHPICNSCWTNLCEGKYKDKEWSDKKMKCPNKTRRKIQYSLEFLNNCGKWQVVDSGTKSHVESELKNRVILFHDTDRYRIKRQSLIGV